MQWLSTLAHEAVKARPDGEILIESGSSPSGTYHMGHLREIITCDAVLLELRKRGRDARHISYIDDLDGLRKIPVNIPADYEKYLGRPLCDIPSPDGKAGSYSEYFLKGLIGAAKNLSIDVEFVRSHKKYRNGFFVPAIEKALDKVPQARQALEKISGRQLDEAWSPIQIMENGYLKKRRFIDIDTNNKTLSYEDKNGAVRTTGYAKGEVKLDWRLDWPGRWWLLDVNIEPFGRDHATKGGSYDTGVQIMKDVYKAAPPMPVPYDFVNLAGDTKKMSASKGTGLDALGVVKTLPPEIIRYFMLRFGPGKRLYFDPENGVSQLMDDFAALLAKPQKTADDEQLIAISMGRIPESTVSSVPFSHLVASYQAALKDIDQTLEIIRRTEHQKIVGAQEETIKNELKFIDSWLKNWAPEEVKFDLAAKPPKVIGEKERQYLLALAEKIQQAPKDADGEWFHKAIYELQAASGLSPKQLFSTLYQALVGKEHGPRAGWFLSILPRDWLLKRLKLEA
ncbi:MAG TPA: lysine--tRNA ligase [Candidatus Saccharimonadales bacterium]|nr:lysine--tRNA ligase [Candidatus Saccharimonadales bacterium]